MRMLADHEPPMTWMTGLGRALSRLWFDGRPADLWRLLAVDALLAALLLVVAGCAPPHAACPREVEYTSEQQRQAAAELQALPRDSVIRGSFMPDYGRLRDQARACRGG